MSGNQKVPGVYLIYDETTDKAYVGSSADVERRLRQHNWELRTRRHFNHNLQRAYNSGNKLEVSVCPAEDAKEARQFEQVLIDEHFDSGLLYNVVREVETPRLGIKASQETIEKQRQAALGFRHTEETKQHLSQIAKDRGIPREVIEAGAAARRGRSLSPEHIEKLKPIRKAAMTQEAREHLREVNFGIPHSPEDIERMTKIVREKIGVPVIVDGVQYETIADAAKLLGTYPATIKRRIANKSGKFGNYEYGSKN